MIEEITGEAIKTFSVPVLSRAAISVAGCASDVSNDNIKQMISVLKRASDAITSALDGDQAGLAE